MSLPITVMLEVVIILWAINLIRNMIKHDKQYLQCFVWGYEHGNPFRFLWVPFYKKIPLKSPSSELSFLKVVMMESKVVENVDIFIPHFSNIKSRKC